jgi:hypothetical protein
MSSENLLPCVISESYVLLPVAIIAPTSYIRSSAMLQLLILGDKELRGWSGPQWHKIDTNFLEIGRLFQNMKGTHKDDLISLRVLLKREI